MSQAAQREVEIKSLLSSKEEQDAVLATMKANDPKLELLKHAVYYNHYFSGDAFDQLLADLPDMPAEDAATLKEIAHSATNTSLRTRNKDETSSILVLKGAVGGDADHAVQRMELETVVPLPQAELDELIVKSGFDVLSKWYAEKDYYHYKNVSVELIFSPGYGYMTEVEFVAQSDKEAETAEATVRSVMAELGLTELPGERLARMFAHYNQHWPEYYGTRNTFTLE